MKKIFLTLLLATTCAIFTQAQTEKGTLLLGGSADFTSESVGGSSSSTYTFSPNIGYFVAENFAVGGRVELDGGDNNTNYTIAPFGRYYFTPIGKNAKLFGDASVGYRGNSGGGNGSTVIGIQAGPAFFLNKNTALEVAARFASISTSGASTTEFGLRVGFQIHFGK